MTDLLGFTLGRYRLTERLGRGGMADVYKAYQPGLDRYVAVKVMHPHLADQPEFITRFEREARAVARLRHPHIIQVFDFDVQDEWYFMVMEYVEGSHTLKELLSELSMRGEQLAWSQTVDIIAKVADALDYAHQQGMIHRDIKPSNILMPALDHPLLGDFGIARLAGLSGLTATSVSIGTPSYMSPEQGQGETATEQSDIYALGIVLYECLAGQPPYDADTPFSVILKHINAPLPLPRSVVPDLPEEVERIVLKSLAKNPADRFASAAHMRNALNLAAEHLVGPSIADDVTLVDIPGPVVKQSMIDAPTVVEEFEAAQAAPIESVEPDAGEPEQVAEPHGKPKVKIAGIALIAVALLEAAGYFVFIYLGLFYGRTIDVSEDQIAVCRGQQKCKPLILFGEEYNYNFASWSPDGTEIVFDAVRRGTTWGLFIADLEGNVSTLIPTGSELNSMDPAWSPDGNWIAFHGNGELVMIKPTGGGILVVARGTSENCPFGLAWSPDSQRIAWIGGACGVSQSHIFTINRDGSGYQKIYTSWSPQLAARTIAWDPDGTSIVFMDKEGITHRIKVDCSADLKGCIPGEETILSKYPDRWKSDYTPQWGIRP
jgi:tRNA A-37 threonylcarbamoyl transferase component Bud32